MPIPAGTITLRRYRIETDTAAVCRVFREAVTLTAADHYTPEEINVWLKWGQNETVANHLLRRGKTWVAEGSRGILGFLQLHPSHHINMLYVAPDAGHQGLGTQLIRRALLESHARTPSTKTPSTKKPTPVSTHASRVSRGLFQKMGFTLIHREAMQQDGETLERFLMQFNQAAPCGLPGFL